MSDHTDIVVRLRLEGSDLAREAALAIEFLRECLTQAEVALSTIRGSLQDALDEEPPFTVTDVAPDTPR